MNETVILKGIPVSPGISIGTVLIYQPMEYRVNECYFEKGLESQKMESFWLAVKNTQEELDEIMHSSEKEDAARIFRAHKEILSDEEMLEMVGEEISVNRKEPEFAIATVFDEFIDLMKQASDPLIAARASDIRDVRNRLLRKLKSEPEKNLSNLEYPVIVVASDLSPGDAAVLDRNKVLGIITGTGGVTSHTAIVANSYRIPAVLGVRNCTSLLLNGMTVALDALQGDIYVNPDADMLAVLNEKGREYSSNELELETRFLEAEPLTADGTRIDIGLNMGSREVLETIRGFDFVGIFRTEFLYTERNSLPSEEEQFQIYKKVIEDAKGKPVTLRTLDIGGDKTLRYMNLPKEDNPFLGKRALRLCFDREDIFVTQLRAALRASVYGELWIMLPMVSSIDDIIKARSIYDRVKLKLEEEKIHIGSNTKLGIMIEIPAIAVIADIAAEYVDFASIGTNDLCQYLCAVDRMNPELAEYYQGLSPAMLRILGFVIESFNSKSKPLSVCGELAADPYSAVLLIGLGLRKLSMSYSSIARVKKTLLMTTIKEAVKYAEKAKNLHTEKQVLDYICSMVQL